MSEGEWLWAIIGTVALCAIAMQVPAWLEERVSATKPMSARSKAVAKNVAWLLCASLLGGFVGGAVASRRGTAVNREPDVDSSDISRLQSELGSLQRRIRDLESKVDR